VEHAGSALYSYCSRHGIVLLFNCIYEVVGVIIGSNCFTLNALSPTQKVNSRIGLLQLATVYRALHIMNST
jgi:hypothetical protein